MKKNILFICAVFFLGSSFAQSGMQKVPVERTAVNNSAAITPNITPSSNSSVVPNPIWENTFDDMSEWLLENSSVPPLDWMISTDPAIIGQQVTPVPSSLTPFASATASDGFFFISSDNTGGGDNDGTPVHAWATCRDTIDCSLYPYVQLTFSHSYRWWQDTRGVRVSGDGGITWQEYEITNQAGYPNDQNTPNPEVTTYDISSVAGGRPEVMVQFYYNDNDYWGWYWAVDDASISEIPDNGIEMNSEVIGGWWETYTSTTVPSLGQDYTFNPKDQIASNPYAFEAVLKNTGIADQEMTLYVDVTDANGVSVHNASSTPITLSVAQQDTVVASSNWAPSQNGVYTIHMWAIADSSNSGTAAGITYTYTDTITKTTEVTDYTYGKDLDFVEGYWRLSRTVGGSQTNFPGSFEIAADYDIYAPTTIYSVDAYITAESTPGANVYVKLYSIDADPNLDPFLESTSDDYVIGPIAMNGGWINIPFLSTTGIALTPGTYSIAIGGYTHPVDSACIATSANGLASADRMFDKDDFYQNGVPSWYTISDVPVLRMNFDPATAWVPTNTSDLNKSLVSIYPNPTNGMVNIQLAGNSDYNINVTNILGEQVYNSIIKGSTSHGIDLSSFDKGIYTIELSNNNEVYVEKVIIE